MAKKVTKDAYLVLDVGTSDLNLSADMKSISGPEGVNVQDTTAFGSAGEESLGGLTKWSVTAVLYQNYTASGPDKAIEDLMAAGAAIAIEYMPTGSVIGATNPKRAGNVIIESYEPVSSVVGTMPEYTLVMRGTGALPTRTEA